VITLTIHVLIGVNCVLPPSVTVITSNLWLDTLRIKLDSQQDDTQHVILPYFLGLRVKAIGLFQPPDMYVRICLHFHFPVALSLALYARKWMGGSTKNLWKMVLKLEVLCCLSRKWVRNTAWEN